MKIEGIWRKLTTFWTIVFFAAIIYDYITHNSLDSENLLLPIAVIYDAVLAIYSAEKEFKRWRNRHRNIHPGELFVILWTILIFCLLALSIIFHQSYHVPSEVSSSYVVVVGILAITKESKYSYRQLRNKIQPKDDNADEDKDADI